MFQELDLSKGNVTILGGTGTLGRELTRSITTNWPECNITILSRDEHKQAAMRKHFPKCRYLLGDIRNARSVEAAFYDCDVVFDVAALKHVDILESCPMESVATNVIATEEMARLAVVYGIPFFVFSSTDKAVDPINAYGYSKALSEKILYNWNARQSDTRFSVYRWGNVLGSQGSVIPTFVKTLKEGRRVYITDHRMTRYWIPIEWSVLFMLRTMVQAKTDQAMVPPTMKAAPLLAVVEAVADIMGIDEYAILKVPIRPGEKIHEAMYSQHSEFYQTSETAPQYTHEELINMLTPVVKAAM